MHSSSFGILFLTGVLAVASAGPGPRVSRVGPDSTVAGLSRLVGLWGPSASSPRAAQRPELRRRVVHDYSWTVQGKALRLREGYALGHREMAELDGLIYWNPATERIEFVAVGGPGPAEGRLFLGEYRLLADSAIERIYDVFYRTLADTPGEELGGARRRYREVYRPVGPDTIEATLDWWRGGRWEPFGPGTYTVVRLAA
ncbi:MAG: hypothetical protein ACREOF_19540 [Gemmatimonadales bacterium]